MVSSIQIALLLYVTCRTEIGAAYVLFFVQMALDFLGMVLLPL